jgi:sporulation protein YlmC with PRC-barrel domain
MDISAMDRERVQELFDAEVVGPDGQQIGTVEQIFADDVTGAPTFITVKSGDRESYIPVSGAEFDTDTVTIPFSGDVVDAAPSASEAEELSLEQETSLYRYYGIRPPRRSSATPAESDETPAGEAVPPSHAQSEEAEEPAGSGEPEDIYRRPVPSEDASVAAEEPVVADVPDWETPLEDEASDQVVGDDLAPDEADLADSAELDLAEPAEDPLATNEFRSIEEVDEAEDPAAPQPPADDRPAEEVAVLGEEASGPADEAQAEAADPLAVPIIEPGEVDKLEETEGTRPVVSADRGDAVLPDGAKLRKYVITEMVTVQVPVRREVVCYEDADGVLHELETIAPPASSPAVPES